MHNVLYLMVGLPGSGKTTYAKDFVNKHKGNIVYLSSDELRAKFGTGETDQSVNSQVFSYIRNEVDSALKANQTVLVDATNITKWERSGYINIANKYQTKVIAVVFRMDRAGLIERNEKRGLNGGRIVPTHVIDKMLNKYEAPTNSEGIFELNYV